MKKFKRATLILVTASLLSAQVQAQAYAQAYANEVQQENVQALSVAAFTQTDIDTMFVQMDQPMQLAMLSQQEMKETEGAFLPAFLAIISIISAALNASAAGMLIAVNVPKL
ncbi:MAG: hypothetical protein WAN92_07000 [Herbaspirillum sp.]